MVTIIICNISCNDGKHDSLDRFKYTAGSNNYNIQNVTCCSDGYQVCYMGSLSADIKALQSAR